ncbi:methyltransferase domain-containing protein [Actinoplanes sp. KI2]|uniref:class I SAM-dependent methyltransferase n=1 Tax=Actinoplanes sp. KI2 TaxID=2983315 RepID=UPI0021D585A7|nr:class I SAM-dependent methyltransferase [Actinoplanes sp. KI2]MCU7725625.1 methyltransferase domain-containing protein [Actinoplanes sp. KI2]
MAEEAVNIVAPFVIGNAEEYERVLARQLPEDQASGSYDDIGTSFDTLFGSADDLTVSEAESLDRIIRQLPARTVLDCTCGTGIQAVGLAALNYVVSASDISTAMVQAVESKAREKSLDIEVRLSDVLHLAEWGAQCFDATVSGGNSLAVLSSRDDVFQAIRSMANRTRDGGLVVVGGRDYALVRDRQEAVYGRGLRLVSEGVLGTVPEWTLDLRLFGVSRVQVRHTFLSLRDGLLVPRSFVKSLLYLSAADIVSGFAAAGLRNISVTDITGEHEYAGGDWYICSGRVGDEPQS